MPELRQVTVLDGDLLHVITETGQSICLQDFDVATQRQTGMVVVSLSKSKRVMDALLTIIGDAEAAERVIG